MRDISKNQYEYALGRIEELLPLVSEGTSLSDPVSIELEIVSDIVELYEKEHFPIEKPSVGE